MSTTPPHSLGRRLRFHQLELVSEVAECGSLGEAAERLHISRAAVSKALKELEHSLGQVLFDRSARGMAPTAAGLRVAKHARLLLNELRHMTQEMGAAPAAAAARLRIGAPPFVAAHMAPEVLLRLRQRLPGQALAVQLHEGRLSALIEQLLLGELDAVMALYAPRAVDALDLGMLTIKHCQEVPMAVVASPALGIARRKRHRWQDLLPHPWILPPASTHLRRSVDEMFTAHGSRAPLPAIESGSLAANVQLASAGLGLAVVPARSAEAEVAAGRLRVLAMQQPLPETTVVLMYRKVSAIYMDAIQALDEAAGEGVCP
jgi:DNA-binding transcriptional LysR family regulator